ncbi:hypothetical protein P5V15_001223 [Pogonomyrmex californicus]
MRKVCAPVKPKDVSLKEKVTNYIKPKINKTVLRAQFWERKQKEEETVTQLYCIAALRSLATECDFADEEEAIRDQLLSGIRSKTIKIALFKVNNLILDVAMKTAAAIEEANKAAEEFETGTQNEKKIAEDDTEVYRVRTWRQNKRNGQRNMRQRPREQSAANDGSTGDAGKTHVLWKRKSSEESLLAYKTLR